MPDVIERAAKKTILMSLQSAASETGIPYASLRDLVIAGHLKRVQLGDSRRIWVKRADIDRLVESR